MKNRILALIALTIAILMVALAVPVFAQQSGSSDQQVAPAIQAESDRPPLTVPKSPDFWDGDDPNVVNLIAHPFANKKYVHRLTDPIRDRLNELDQITAEQKAHTRDIDTRTQQGLQLASEKVTLADQHASDAQTKAENAQAAATQVSSRVASTEQKITSIDAYKGDAQTEIRFRAGQSVLSKSAKDALDQMAGPLKAQRSYIIEVRGFAPGSGSAAIVNSKKMADSVVRYLVLTHGIPMYRIYELSMGNASTGEGMAGKRASASRVEVNVLKNDLTAQR